MSNILCLAVSKIKHDGKLEFNESLGAEKTYRLYEAMSEIVIHSAETFLQEDFEIVVFEDEVSSYQEIFHKNFSNVSETWQEDGPNNILYLDCDTLVVAPVEIFGKFDRFQMFNYTARRSLPADTNKYGLKHDHYFNAGVRYYPESMHKEVWDTGWKYAQDWDYDFWGTEQVIFNEMMYSQDPNVNTWLKPEFGYQLIGVPHTKLDDIKIIKHSEQWNNMLIKDAKIMHLHGTRDAMNTLLLQWELWRRITGEEFTFSHFNVVTDEQTGRAVGLQEKNT
jgi:hypothetical protein